jgi:hypothetical protein
LQPSLKSQKPTCCISNHRSWQSLVEYLSVTRAIRPLLTATRDSAETIMLVEHCYAAD